MGHKDQRIKQLFEEETPILTKNGARFSVPPETKTTELHADGLLSVHDAETLKNLAAPWSLIESDEVLLEFKMQGDKTGRYEVERALLRRQAWQAQRARNHPNDATQVPLWMISAKFPDWLRSERFFSQDAPGCYRVKAEPHRFYFIAANELPLVPELFPFLLARTGQYAVELGRWILHQGSKTWLESLLEVASMSDAQLEEFTQEIPDITPEEVMRRKRLVAMILAKQTGVYQEALQEGAAQGLEQGLERGLEQGLERGLEQGLDQGIDRGKSVELERLFARRVGRPLSEAEQRSFAEKLASLGHERLEDVLFEKRAEALAAWLGDPAAR
jgi:hypothetical protein